MLRSSLSLFAGLLLLTLAGCESEPLFEQSPMDGGDTAASGESGGVTARAESRVAAEQEEKPSHQTHRVGHIEFSLSSKWEVDRTAPAGIHAFAVRDANSNVLGRVLVMEIPPQIPLPDLADGLARQFSGQVVDRNLELDGKSAFRLKMPPGSDQHPEASILVEHAGFVYSIGFAQSGSYDFEPDINDVIRSVKFL